MRINSTGLLATNGKHFPLPATPREPPTPLSHGLVPSLSISVQSRHSAQLFEPMNAARALFLPLCGGTRGAAGLFLLGRLSGSGEIRARDTLPMGAGGNSTSSSLSLSLSLAPFVDIFMEPPLFFFHEGATDESQGRVESSARAICRKRHVWLWNQNSTRIG